VKLAPEDVELIDRLVRGDRTAVSTALLAIAGIGAGEPRRKAVLAGVAEAASWARAEGAISGPRAEQIARHVRRALPGCAQPRLSERSRRLWRSVRDRAGGPERLATVSA
jgi:hypothetical protein